MSENLQNTIVQTEINNGKQFKNVRTEVIIWYQITTDTGKKTKFET